MMIHLDIRKFTKVLSKSNNSFVRPWNVVADKVRFSPKFVTSSGRSRPLLSHRHGLDEPLQLLAIVSSKTNEMVARFYRRRAVDDGLHSKGICRNARFHFKSVNRELVREFPRRVLRKRSSLLEAKVPGADAWRSCGALFRFAAQIRQHRLAQRRSAGRSRRREQLLDVIRTFDFRRVRLYSRES